MINSLDSSNKEIEDLFDLYTLATEENNKLIIEESVNNLKKLHKKVKKK